MKQENEIWLDALDPKKFKADRELINIQDHKCYHFLSQFVSFKAILALDNHLKFQIATREDPVLKEMRATIKDDVLIIKGVVRKNKAEEILSDAKIDGIKGCYYYLRLPEGWHRVITFRKIFSLFGLEYTKFHLDEDENESPGFETREELVEHWNNGFFDKTTVMWRL